MQIVFVQMMNGHVLLEEPNDLRIKTSLESLNPGFEAAEPFPGLAATLLFEWEESLMGQITLVSCSAGSAERIWCCVLRLCKLCGPGQSSSQTMI